MSNPFKSFTRGEWILWITSLIVVTISYFAGSRDGYLTLGTTLLGVTCVLMVAKGLPIGELLSVVFAILYAAVSFTFAYYGEMFTYLGMSLPMSAVAFISWLRHPYDDTSDEVEMAALSRKKVLVMSVLAILVTWAFYYILEFFDTANLGISTISVTTSFLAAWLLFLRHYGYALAYAANDAILIVMWILASIEDPQYIPMVANFSIFLINDMYGFFNWRRIGKRQNTK